MRKELPRSARWRHGTRESAYPSRLKRSAPLEERRRARTCVCALVCRCPEVHYLGWGGVSGVSDHDLAYQTMAWSGHGMTWCAGGVPGLPRQQRRGLHGLPRRRPGRPRPGLPCCWVGPASAAARRRAVWRRPVQWRPRRPPWTTPATVSSPAGSLAGGRHLLMYGAVLACITGSLAGGRHASRVKPGKARRPGGRV